MNSLDYKLGSELSVRILSEISDAIIATDLDHHVFYWNSQAERFYGRPAHEALGRRLDACAPGLFAALVLHDLPNRCLRERLPWRGELTVYANSPRYLEVSVSLVGEVEGRAAGVVYVQRDITALRCLEEDLNRYRSEAESLGGGAGASATTSAQGGASLAGAQTLRDSRGIVLWAEDDEDDAFLMTRAWQKAEVEDELVRVRSGTEVIEYLLGEGRFQDRHCYPLPRLLVLDLNLPGVPGLEVAKWVHDQPAFKHLPVVILTCSDAPQDIQGATQCCVKAYLAKPAEAAEWLMKVRTLTSQCV